MPIVTVETIHFFETNPMGADTPVHITVKLDVTLYEPAITNAPMEQCRPAEGGTVEVLETAITFDAKIQSIPNDWFLDMAKAIEDIKAGKDDDELYELAMQELVKLEEEHECRREDIRDA